MENTIKNGKIVQDNELNRVTLTEDKQALLFVWKHVSGLTLLDFKDGIAQFAAGLCKTYKPARAIFDARLLDSSGDPFAWVTGQKKFEGEEEYNTWWMREIVPIYNEAGISSLSVATGDPNAPGELKNMSEQVHFKVGYFEGIETAMEWKK